MAKAGCDDVFPVGPANLVFPALVEFEREVRELCGLELQRNKCRVLTWDGIIPSHSITGMPIAGRFESGMMVYGVPVGSDEYVKSMMETKMNEIASEVTKACTVLADERQALWTTLRLRGGQNLMFSTF